MRSTAALRPSEFRGFAVDVAARGIVREWNRRLRPYGLSYIPYFVLLLVAAEDGVRPSDLSAALQLDGSSLSGHLDRLAAVGLVERRAVPDDRRGARIVLTPGGERLVAELEPLGRVMSALEPAAGAVPRLGPEEPRALGSLGDAVRGAAAAFARVEDVLAAGRPAPVRPRAGLATTLRATTLTAPRSAVGGALTRFAALVGERSDGTIRIDLDLPSQAPGGELQTLVDVRSGDVAFAAITLPVAGTLVPDAQLVELPYLFDAWPHAQAFLDGPFALGIGVACERFGLAVLGIAGNGFRSITHRDRAIHDPEDLAGARLRVQQTPINLHLAEALGAVAVPIPYPRLAAALAGGEIDAQENALANVAGLELWRHQHHLTLTRHAFSAHIVLANAEILAALGSGAALVRDAMRDAIDEHRATAAALDEALEGELDARMATVTLHAAGRRRFVEATQLVRERLARALGDDAVSRVLAAAAASRPLSHA